MPTECKEQRVLFRSAGNSISDTKLQTETIPDTMPEGNCLSELLSTSDRGFQFISRLLSSNLIYTINYGVLRTWSERR